MYQIVKKEPDFWLFFYYLERNYCKVSTVKVQFCSWIVYAGFGSRTAFSTPSSLMMFVMVYVVSSRVTTVPIVVSVFICERSIVGIFWTRLSSWRESGSVSSAVLLSHFFAPKRVLKTWATFELYWRCSTTPENSSSVFWAFVYGVVYLTVMIDFSVMVSDLKGFFRRRKTPAAIMSIASSHLSRDFIFYFW